MLLDLPYLSIIWYYYEVIRVVCNGPRWLHFLLQGFQMNTVEDALVQYLGTISGIQRTYLVSVLSLNSTVGLVFLVRGCLTYLCAILFSGSTDELISYVDQAKRSGNVAWNASKTHDSVRLILTKYGIKVTDINRLVLTNNIRMHQRLSQSVYNTNRQAACKHNWREYCVQEIFMRVPMHKIGWVMHYTEDNEQVSHFNNDNCLCSCTVVGCVCDYVFTPLQWNFSRYVMCRMLCISAMTITASRRHRGGQAWRQLLQVLSLPVQLTGTTLIYYVVCWHLINGPFAVHSDDKQFLRINAIT